MKHIFIMKTRNIIISILTLLLSVTGVFPLHAKYFRAGDKIYINTYSRSSGDTEFDWAEAGAHLVMKFWKDGGGSEWLEFHDKEYEHNDNKIRIMSAVIANDAEYDKCQIIRRNGDWAHTTDSDWGHTGTMPIEDVYIYRYWFNGIVGNWAHTLPAGLILAPYRTDLKDYAGLKADLVASGLPVEEYSICPNAAGDIMSLHCKINAGRTDYEEGDVWQHAWYYSIDNGATWETLDNYAGRIRNKNGDYDEGDRTISPTLPDPIPSTICYYLYSRVSSGQRLIKYTLNDEGCDYDCTITASERAISNVNAETNTYTLDGLVAFGVANGDLVIEYGKGTSDYQKMTIESPVSPQAFSLTDIPAALTDGVVRKLTAYFTGDATCTKDFTDVPVPNVVDAIIAHPTINLLTGTSHTLTPSDYELSDEADWVDAKDVAHAIAAGAAKSYTTMPSDTAGTHHYIYKEYYPLSGDNENMMTNGDYEEESGYGTMGSVSEISDYIFWNRYDNASTVINFYDNEAINPKIGSPKHPTYESNGFAVIQNAKNFHNKYASVVAKHPASGHFGLYDAASDGVSGKKAWYANTTNNSKLKLKKGTTYVFSFWAANINNYGEMDNAAKLQFQIEYNDKTELLGDPLDLGSDEFRNNRWHQCSKMFYATEDADDVTISVVNLNTDRLRVGNDFALDDIQFHAVSTVTRVAKSYQTFEVVFHEPTISDFIATPVQMGCGESSYAVDLHIEYKNQCGKIIVKDITGGADRVVWDTTLIALPGAGAGATWEEVKEINRRVVQTIGSSDPVGKERTYKVYFEDWTSAYQTDNFNDPVIPVLTATNDNNPTAILPCDQLTYTLNVSVSYRNMSSDKIQVWVDGASYAASSLKQEKTIDKNTSTIKTVSFAIDNVPADSAEHVLHVECAGLGDGCFEPLTFRAPFAPKVVEPIAVSTSAITCSPVSTTYTATVDVTTENHRNATLSAKLNSATPVSKIVKGDVTQFTFEGLKADGGKDTVKVYFDYVHGTRPACDKTRIFDAPFRPVVETVTCTPSAYVYGELTYSVTVRVTTSNFLKDGTRATLTVESTDLGKQDQVSHSAQVAADGTWEYTFTGLKAEDGVTRHFKAYFDDLPSCFETQEFPSLDARNFKTFEITSYGAVDCSGNYVVNYKIESTALDGDILIKEGSTTRNTHTIAENDLAPKVITGSVTLSANGSTHTLRAIFEDHDTYYKDVIAEARSFPTIEFTKGDHSLDCDGIVTVPLTIRFTNQTTALYIDSAGVKIKTFSASEVTSAPTTVAGKQQLTYDWKFSADNTAHTLTAYFKDRESCNPSITQAAVNAGVFKVKQGVFTAPTCGDITYTLHDTIIYRNMDTDAEVWLDGVKKLDVDVTNDNPAELKEAFDLTIPADSLEHTLTVKFGGRGVECPSAYSFRAPFSPQINSVVVTGTDALSCGGSSTYTAIVTLNTTNQRNAAIMVSLNDGTPVRRIPTTASTVFEFSDLPADGSTNTVKAWFECMDAIDATCKTTETFTAPALPKASLVTPITMPDDVAACDQPTFNLTFDLKYTYQDGELQVWVDDDKKGYTTFAASATDGEGKYLKLNISEQTKTITLSGLPSDGGTTHKLYYKFDKSGYCNNTSSPFTLSTFPRSPTITGVTVSGIPAKVADCTVETYDATVTVEYQYTSGEKIMIGYTNKDNVAKTYGPVTLTGSPQVITLDDVLDDIGKGSKTLQVYFRSGSEDLSCKHDGTYTAPSNSSINSEYDVTVTNTSKCGERKYNLSGTVTYVGEATDDLHVQFKVGETLIKDSVILKANCSPSGTAFTMTGLTTAVSGHSLIAYFEDQPKCTAASKPFDAPDICGFDAPKAKMSYSTPACGEITTTLTFDLNYTYQNGDKLQVWVDGGSKKEVSFEANANNEKTITGIEITGVSADGAPHTLHVEFVNGRCAAKTFTTPAAPFNPKPIVAINSITNQCDYESSTTVTYTTTYANTYNYYIVGKTELLVTAKTATAAGSFTLDISSLDAGTYTLKMVANSTDCVSDTVSKTFTVYPKPEIKITDIDNQCDYKTETTVKYTTSAATTYNYYIVGKTELLTTAQTASASGSFTLDISSLDKGTYTLKMVANSANCVSDTVSETFTVYPKPDVKITGIENQCDYKTETTITYTTADATTYNYYIVGKTSLLATAETASASGSFTLDISSLDAGTYTLKMVANSDYCVSDTVSKTFTVYPKPDVKITGIENRCDYELGTTVTYTTSDATTYNYYIVGKTGLLATAETASASGSFTLDISSLDAGTYTLKMVANSANCVSDTVSETFIVYPKPDVKITGIENQCDHLTETTVTYTTSAATTYNYYIVGKTELLATAETASASGSFTLDISSLNAGTYTLKMVANSDHCVSDTVTKTFTIYSEPTIEITEIDNQCDYATSTKVYYTTTGADTYKYRIVGYPLSDAKPASASGSFTLDISSLDAGNYILRIVANSGTCACDSVDASFVVYPEPKISATVDNQCDYVTSTTVAFKATDATTYNYYVPGKTQLLPAAKDVPTSGVGTFTLDISTYDAGAYNLKIVANSTTCKSDTAVVPFTVYPKPDVKITGINNKCDNETETTVTYTTSNATTYNYYIVGKTGLLETAPSASASGSFTLDISSLDAGTYTLKMVANSTDCKSDTIEKTFEIYPLPTFTFKTAVAHDCYPSISISVGYTSTNAKTYSYTLTKEGAGSPARTVADQSAADEGAIVLNTTDLAAGTYELEVTAKSDHNCELTAPVTKTVTIYNQPIVDITSVENHCEGSDDITVGYTAEYATDYTYEVVGTTISGHGTVTEPGSFKINLSSLDDGDYTLRMHVTAAHSPLTCDGTTDEESFTVWAVPEVSFVTPAPIKEGVANVTVTLELDKAETYDWRFMNGTTTLESGADVPAGTTTITLTTGALTEGTYTLFVTPKTSHCTGEEKEVHVVVNNKPTINFTDPDIVCAGTSTLNVEYSTSPDATDLYYTIMQGTTTVVAEQHVDLTTATSPLAVNISGLPYGNYTLTGYVSSSLESGDNSPVDFTLLAVPTIHTVTQDVTFIGCEETYEATIKVNIFNAAGRKIYAKYTDDGEHTAHVETSVGDETATITLTGLTHTDLSGKHQVHVYVDGFEGCGVTAEYDEPKLMTITEGFEVTPLPKSCGDEKFTLTGKVVANCNVGKIVVEYDDTYKAEVDASTSGSDFTIADIPAGGSVTQLKAYFQGKTCGVVESVVFAEPTKPEASITYTPFVTPACDVPTFDLEFSLDYIYQEAGMLTVWVDDDHKSTYTNGTDSETDKYVALAESEKTLVGTIEGLPADGRTGQKLYFEFNGSHSCKGSVDLAQFPRTPLITGVEIVAGSIPDLVPGESGTYSPEFTVSYKWTAGETLVLEYQKANGNWEQTTTTVSGEGTYTFSGLTFDDVAMENREVHVHFDGAEFSECVHPLPYTTPSNSSAQFVSVEQVNTSTCDHLRYDLKGFVTFVGEPVGDLIVAFADSVYVIKNADCIGKANTNLPFEIKNVEVDIPAAGMQLVTYFSGISDHKATSDEVFNNPVIPHIEIANASYSTPECNSTKTTLTFDLSYLKQQGSLHVFVDGIEQTYTLSENLSLNDETTRTVTVTVADQPANTAVREMRVLFDGSNSCDRSFTLPAAPFGPAITPGEAEASNFTCGSDVYDVTVTISVANHLGKAVTVRCHGQEKTLAATDAQMRVLFTDVNRTMDDTADDFVEIFFADASNAADCADSHIKITYVEPAKPVLEVTDAKVDTVFTCGAKEYRVHFNITSSDQIGDCYVIDRTAGGEERTLSTHIGTYSGEEQLTIVRPETAETHDIIVRYTATNCEVVAASVLANPYTKPKPLISLNAIDRLCNSEAELNLPFVITQGDIDEATITLTDSKGKTVLSNAAMDINDSKDTLSYLLAEQLSAGKYTVSVEARDTLDCVTTATLPIELAEDGVVFSKWTDVLLVDNTLGLYTAYQWYENGQPLQGKNEQVLYLPGGMNGTYTCLLTTADGQIFTCEYAFADIPRSADNQQSANHITVLPNRVKAGGMVTVQQSEQETLRLILLSATGQRVAEYTQTESAKLVDVPGVQGIYLLRVASESDVQTVKIVVY